MSDTREAVISGWAQGAENNEGLNVVVGKDYGHAIDLSFVRSGGRYLVHRITRDTPSEMVANSLRALADFIVGDTQPGNIRVVTTTNDGRMGCGLMNESYVAQHLRELGTSPA